MLIRNRRYLLKTFQYQFSSKAEESWNKSAIRASENNLPKEYKDLDYIVFQTDNNHWQQKIVCSFLHDIEKSSPNASILLSYLHLPRHGYLSFKNFRPNRIMISLSKYIQRNWSTNLSYQENIKLYISYAVRMVQTHESYLFSKRYSNNNGDDSSSIRKDHAAEVLSNSFYMKGPPIEALFAEMIGSFLDNLPSDRSSTATPLTTPPTVSSAIKQESIRQFINQLRIVSAEKLNVERIVFKSLIAMLMHALKHDQYADLSLVLDVFYPVDTTKAIGALKLIDNQRVSNNMFHVAAHNLFETLHVNTQLQQQLEQQQSSSSSSSSSSSIQDKKTKIVPGLESRFGIRIRMKAYRVLALTTEREDAMTMITERLFLSHPHYYPAVPLMVWLRICGEYGFVSLQARLLRMITQRPVIATADSDTTATADSDTTATADSDTTATADSNTTATADRANEAAGKDDPYQMILGTNTINYGIFFQSVAGDFNMVNHCIDLLETESKELHILLFAPPSMPPLTIESESDSEIVSSIAPIASSSSSSSEVQVRQSSSDQSLWYHQDLSHLPENQQQQQQQQQIEHDYWKAYRAWIAKKYDLDASGNVPSLSTNSVDTTRFGFFDHYSHIDQTSSRHKSMGSSSADIDIDIDTSTMSRSQLLRHLSIQSSAHSWNLGVRLSSLYHYLIGIHQYLIIHTINKQSLTPEARHHITSIMHRLVKILETDMIAPMPDYYLYMMKLLAVNNFQHYTLTQLLVDAYLDWIECYQM
jgi:hypothetical protein